MLCVIPYKDYGGPELKYCLRGIEKYVDNAEVLLIGQKPAWIRNVEHIPFADDAELRYKERNIYQKILQVKRDFLFFNDDHYLLGPFDKNTYHYTGTLSKWMNGYDTWNNFRKTIQNTIDLVGDVNNYFRHGPIYCEHEILERLQALDWDKPWGYCVKTIYCYLADIKGLDYPDLKIKVEKSINELRTITRERKYFSTGNHCMNTDMLAFLEETYPTKSKFET